MFDRDWRDREKRRKKIFVAVFDTAVLCILEIYSIDYWFAVIFIFKNSFFLFLQWVTTVFVIIPRGAGIATGSRPGQERRENFILQC